MPATRGHRSPSICRRCCRSRRRRSSSMETETAVVRIELPPHLQTLARVGREVLVDVRGEVTQRAVLDALEAAYPVLRGTIRDRATLKRRAFMRFFACSE